MASFLSEERARIDEKLKELRPLHEEYLELERVKQALDSVEKPRRGPGRPRGSTGAAGGGRRRRRRSGGTRADQALQAVRQNPGVTVGELARQLGVQPNYLYRVMNGLQDDGAVKKQGKGYTATEPAAG